MKSFHTYTPRHTVISIIHSNLPVKLSLFLFFKFICHLSGVFVHRKKVWTNRYIECIDKYISSFQMDFKWFISCEWLWWLYWCTRLTSWWFISNCFRQKYQMKEKMERKRALNHAYFLPFRQNALQSIAQSIQQIL